MWTPYLLVLFAVFGFGLAVWSPCPPKRPRGVFVSRPTTTTTPKPPRKGYECNGAGAGEQKTTVILGILLNQGTEIMERSLPSSQYGVEVLKPHPLNYSVLVSAEHLWGDEPGTVRWEFESKNLTAEIRNISLEPERMATVYQKTSICNYFGEFYSESVDGAVKVYSEPAVVTFKLGWDPCTDSTTTAGIEYDYKNKDRDPTIRVKGNFGNRKYEIPAHYNEGFEDTTTPPGKLEPYDHTTGRGDDTEKLLQKISEAIAQIPSPSPASGVRDLWSHFVISGGFGKPSTRRNFTLFVPPARKAKLYRGVAECGPMRVYGPAFPVYRDPLVDQDWVTKNGWQLAGACESPNVDPCVMGPWHKGAEVGSPELIFMKGFRCEDGYETIEVPEGAKEFKIKIGLKGPWADKVSDEFKKVFNERLQKIHYTANTKFTWASYEIDKWIPYGSENATKTIQLREGSHPSTMHQVMVDCGLYSYYTGAVFEGNERYN